LSRWTTVLAFTLAYLAAAAAGALATGNGEFLYYIGVMVVLMGAVGVLHLRVRLSPGALWGLSLWGLLHMVGGLVPLPAGWAYDGPHAVFYSWWLVPDVLKYDMAVHAYGFGLTTWVCWQGYGAAVRGAGGAPRPTFGALVLCAAAGMGFGALNEVIEFAATLLMRDTNVGGYVNTGWDLVSNLSGCIAAALLIRWGRKRPPEREA
jgi:hypothetical protein